MQTSHCLAGKPERLNPFALDEAANELAPTVLLPLCAGDICCGTPVGFDVVTARGELMLARGLVVDSEAQVTKIHAIGMKRIVDPHAGTVPVFARVRALAADLGNLFERVVSVPSSPLELANVKRIAREIVDLDAADHHAAFACVHLDFRSSYDVVHHLMAALLCTRAAGPEGLSRSEQEALVAAALTNDIALIRMRHQIDLAQTLCERDRSVIDSHCDDAVAGLLEIGVADDLWLGAVRDHHEFLDGSGYRGLRAPRITFEARMLAIADAFGAMLRERPYRARQLARTALANLYSDPRGRYDCRLLDVLVGHYGPIPPGSTVRLANNEVAVVVRPRPDAPETPLVASVCDRRGLPLAEPCRRDTANEAHRIVSTMPPEFSARLGRTIEGCWNHD